MNGTRLPVGTIPENAEDCTPEEVATAIFQGITPEDMMAFEMGLGSYTTLQFERPPLQPRPRSLLPRD